MMYTTEFKIDRDYPIVADQRERYVEYRKREGDAAIGNLIHNVVGYDGPVGYESDRYKLQIQAFKQSDWVNFRFKIKEALKSLGPYDLKIVRQIFEELESIGSEKATKIDTNV